MARHARARLADRLRQHAEGAGVAMDEPLAEQLGSYVDLLRRWNAKLNLTRLDRDDAGLARLVIEPLAAIPYLPAQALLVDIGSGGGSPAIPVKLAAPGLALRMIEAKTRKAAFLREAVRHLGLDRTEVLAERYEALLGRRDLQDAHDALVVRGVHLDAEVLRRLQAFVAPGGTLLLFRGPEPMATWTDAAPSLLLEAAVPLGGASGSRLIVLRRRSCGVSGGESVPRGTPDPASPSTPAGRTASAGVSGGESVSRGTPDPASPSTPAGRTASAGVSGGVSVPRGTPDPASPSTPAGRAASAAPGADSDPDPTPSPPRAIPKSATD